MLAAKEGAGGARRAARRLIAGCLRSAAVRSGSSGAPAAFARRQEFARCAAGRRSFSAEARGPAASGLRTAATSLQRRARRADCSPRLGAVRCSSHPASQSAPATSQKKVTITTLRNMYKKGVPIAMMTAHDYPSGLFVENGQMDICLVGDSLGMVALGYPNTSQLTMDDMIHHCRAVARAITHPFLIGDMPFGSYETSETKATENAIRLMKEGKVEAVKLEGGIEMASTAHRIQRVGIPVMGHIGLTPHRQSAMGGYRVQGKTAAKARLLLKDAQALQDAGCFAIIVEGVPAPTADYITANLKIPTIGIGAGPGCSGQVLVQNDMLGIFDKFVPRFCKQYTHITTVVGKAMEQYRTEVKSRTFPAAEHCYPMADGEEDKLRAMEQKEKEDSTQPTSAKPRKAADEEDE
ncbi:MAG: ketopantoate hydroxymethyltransferase-domain-containing protein [Olpidium bornovanus]|uniref:3-methyl-2-oxobutanoate hydroxymethyltransferase n=1 Tax=Olpidium bornovanus TaxID=278681 RepID=A0A8H7ZTU4_9FUNG|nr:MAG: ketopantoate hydroxymethyltransferase-domain-containing protein [Olpidium bornovanus]